VLAVDRVRRVHNARAARYPIGTVARRCPMRTQPSLPPRRARASRAPKRARDRRARSDRADSLGRNSSVGCTRSMSFAALTAMDRSRSWHSHRPDGHHRHPRGPGPSQRRTALGAGAGATPVRASLRGLGAGLPRPAAHRRRIARPRQVPEARVRARRNSSRPERAPAYANGLFVRALNIALHLPATCDPSAPGPRVQLELPMRGGPSRCPARNPAAVLTLGLPRSQERGRPYEQ